MTIDDRLQFLLQSTESLHANVQDLSATVQSLTASVTGLERAVTGLERVVEIDAENIRRLANIAGVHNDGIEDLTARLDRLEKRERSN